MSILFCPPSMESMHIIGRKSYLNENLMEILGSHDLVINIVVLALTMSASLFTFLFVEFLVDLKD